VDVTGTDNDANDRYSDLQWLALTQPVNGSVAVNADGTFAIWRNSNAVTTLNFSYRLMDNGPDNDINTPGDNMYDDATVTVNWPVAGALPVSLINFSAARIGSNVNLQWTTTFENNNSGFQIQRSTDNNIWENSGYVASLAPGGNSSNPVNYQFKETNLAGGITWYRLVQTDKDNTATISSSVGVRGVERSARITIYPNPGTSDNMRVFFGSAAARDILITDLSGRILMSRINYTYDNLMITGLKAGVYMLQVMNRISNERQTHKVLILK
ncbi:MAG TPA: T9SS type A sorting domain-containing protein, partial [Niastella sp.]